MDLTSLSLYVVAVAAVTVMPGPTMLLALNNGAHGGKRIAACGIAGAALSDLILIAAVGGGLGALLRSLLVALSNPKALLFFSAFLPQFIRPESPIAIQYITLALVTALIDIALMSVYALGGHHAMRLLSGQAMRWLNRGCAGMLAGLGLALSVYRRSESD